jgi:hypothetical protein
VRWLRDKAFQKLFNERCLTPEERQAIVRKKAPHRNQMPKPISKQLLDLLQSAPKVKGSIEAYYDPNSCKTRATITYTANDETFTQEIDVCYGPIVDVTDVWIGKVRIPKERITFKK